MLSYRHAFHAGNHADVLKHLALAECLRLLGRKEKGYLLVDTHAGAGAYDLAEGYAAQNAEWREGIARLRAIDPGKAGGAVADYLRLVEDYSAANRGAYPGSPAVAALLLRPQDRAVCCELHPTDHAALEELFRADARIRTRKADGFSELRALLPPPTRRGLVFIDPSYELAADYDRVAESLLDSFRRFAAGVYLVWYPLLDRAEAEELPRRLRSIGSGPALDARIAVEPHVSGRRGLYGSGVFVFNPPWTLEERLREALPRLAAAFGPAADWDLWVRPEPPAAKNATAGPAAASNGA